MNAFRMSTRTVVAPLALALALAVAPMTHAGDFYIQENLVSDQTGKANHLDPNLVNAWGVVMINGLQRVV
jgi:hypothetical protein